MEDVPEPGVRDGSVLVEAISVGVCGTDVEIVEGKYGWSPPGKTRLVLGHESLGRVVESGPRSTLQRGDLVVGIVRRTDPTPCPNCAVGEWDMCRNGQYTERGIKEIDGFMSERWRGSRGLAGLVTRSEPPERFMPALQRSRMTSRWSSSLAKRDQRNRPGSTPRAARIARETGEVGRYDVEPERRFRRRAARKFPA